jgi:hypothetical protein
MELLYVTGKVTSSQQNYTSKYHFDFYVDCDDGRKLVIKKVYKFSYRTYTANDQIKAILTKRFNSYDREYWVAMASEIVARDGTYVYLDNILSPNSKKTLTSQISSPSKIKALGFVGTIISILISFSVVSIMKLLKLNDILSSITVICIYCGFAILSTGLFVNGAKKSNRQVNKKIEERNSLIQEAKKMGFTIDESEYTEL